MALKVRIGRDAGSDAQPQLTATVWDDAGASIERLAAMNAALAAAPADVDGIPIAGVPSVEQVSRSAYRFSLTYSVGDIGQLPRPEPPEMGTLTRTAAFNAQPVTLFNFLEPIGVYDSSGTVTSSWPQTKWKVDSQPDGDGHYVSQGTSFDPLPETRTLNYYIPNASLTETYLDTIEAMVGHFNSTTWRGRPQGSVQFVRFSANERSADDWELSFGFGYKAPRTAFSINGDITIPELRGSWYYWTNERSVFNESSSILEREFTLAVVGRVWDESDFNDLELPA